jgi:hypothetical protein
MVKLFVISTSIVIATLAPAAAQQPSLAGTVTGKACSPFVPNAWRAITSVPEQWTAATCQSLGKSLGATALQLGCFSTGGFSLGAVTGIDAAPVAPTQNCGW